MVLCSVFQTVEFYVIATVVAAAVVASLGRKKQSGPARQIILPGIITQEGNLSVDEPAIELICNDDGSVLLRRHGITGVDGSGAVSLAVEVVGFDVRIKERVAEGNLGVGLIDTAAFLLDFMGREHYFISYESPLTSTSSSLFASLTLHNCAGNRIYKKLQ